MSIGAIRGNKITQYKSREQSRLLFFIPPLLHPTQHDSTSTPLSNNLRGNRTAKQFVRGSAEIRTPCPAKGDILNNFCLIFVRKITIHIVAPKTSNSLVFRLARAGSIISSSSVRTSHFPTQNPKKHPFS